MFPKIDEFFIQLIYVWGEKCEFQVIDSEFLSNENELQKPEGSNICL